MPLESVRTGGLPSPRKCVFCLLVLAALLEISRGHEPEKKWTRDFAVELEADATEAQLVANTHGFDIVREIPDIKVFHFKHPKACSGEHRCKRHAKDLVDLLMNEPHVKRVEQQFILEKEHRSASSPLVSKDHLDLDFDAIREPPRREEEEDEFERTVIERSLRLAPKLNDPMFEKQWHLNNYGQFGNPGIDLNVIPAWRKGYRGNGSRVTIVDDDVDTEHPDLVDNYDPLISGDLNDPTDITGNPRSPLKVVPEDENHGTRCAGEIAAKADNKMCGTGVAPEVTFGGIRVLAGMITDLLESYSILHQNQLIDIYSCSWGPADDGTTMGMQKHYTGRALRYSATTGRKGLGNLFFYASGNGGARGDNCGADPYVNSPFTMAVSAVNVYGRATSYDERCSATFVTVPVGGLPASDSGGPMESFPRITTCKINKDCTDSFMGTSAAAPLGAGCMALVLQANRGLTWRDAQHVLARACRIPNPAQLVWQRNGAGFHVSSVFGFGLLDCSRAVAIAQTWQNVGPREECSFKVFRGKRRIFYESKNVFKFLVKKCDSPSGKGPVNFIEHVLVSFNIAHKIRGDLQLWITSPSGTVSRLLGRRWPDKSQAGMKQTFLSRHLLGEDPHGVWTITVEDTGWRKTQKRNRGTIRSVELHIFGTTEAPDRLPERPKKAHKMSSSEVQETFNKERMEALHVMPLHREVQEMKRLVEKGAQSETVREMLRKLKPDDLSRDDQDALRDIVKKVEK